MASSHKLIISIIFFILPLAAFARTIDAVPGKYVHVSLFGEVKNATAYVDGPLLLWRGSWKKNKTVPQLVVPVRVVFKNIFKLVDPQSTKSSHGELEPETYTPESKIYRLLLPITSRKQTHHYEVTQGRGTTGIPVMVHLSFESSKMIELRHSNCAKLGLHLESTDANKGISDLLYLYCEKGRDFTDVWIYAPFAKVNKNIKMKPTERTYNFEIPSEDSSPLKYQLHYDRSP